jgi:hypothetical protein
LRFFAGFATWREAYPLESGWFTQRRKGAKDRQVKLGQVPATSLDCESAFSDVTSHYKSQFELLK